MFKSKVTQEQLDLMRQMLDAGKSFRQIAEATSLPVATVHYKLADHPRKNVIGVLSTQKEKAPKVFAPKAKAVIPKSAIITTVKFSPPPYAPICAASMTGTYTGQELKYRKYPWK